MILEYTGIVLFAHHSCANTNYKCNVETYTILQEEQIIPSVSGLIICFSFKVKFSLVMMRKLNWTGSAEK